MCGCAGVIIVGVPFPAAKDQKVLLKREFNDNMRKQVSVVCKRLAEHLRSSERGVRCFSA